MFDWLVVFELTLNCSEVFVEKKHKIALEGVQVTKGPYTEFSASLDPSQLKAWTEMAERADSERGEALDIYTLQIDKGSSRLC